MSEGRALGRSELADVMLRADRLYLGWAQTLRDRPFEEWATLLADAPELRDVTDAEPDWYRGLILADLHRQLFPVDSEDEP